MYSVTYLLTLVMKVRYAAFTLPNKAEQAQPGENKLDSSPSCTLPTI